MKKKITFLVLLLLFSVSVFGILVEHKMDAGVLQVKPVMPVKTLVNNNEQTILLNITATDSFMLNYSLENMKAGGGVDFYQILQIRSNESFKGTEFDSIVLDFETKSVESLPYTYHLFGNGSIVNFTNISSLNLTTVRLYVTDDNIVKKFHLSDYEYFVYNVTFLTSLDFDAEYNISSCAMYSLGGECK